MECSFESRVISSTLSRIPLIGVFHVFLSFFIFIPSFAFGCPLFSIAPIKADIDKAIYALDKAVKGLKEPTPTEPVTPPTKQEPSNNSQPTKPSIAQTNKLTRSSEAVAKDKKAAQKIMKQVKITKLTAKSKAKKKITVSW